MTNRTTYKIEVFCTGELQVTADSPDAEETIQHIKQLLERDKKLADAVRNAGSIMNQRGKQLAETLMQRKQLAEGRSLCLPCYGLRGVEAQEACASAIRSMLPDNLTAEFDPKKKGVLHIVEVSDRPL